MEFNYIVYAEHIKEYLYSKFKILTWLLLGKSFLEPSLSTLNFHPYSSVKPSKI